MNIHKQISSYINPSGNPFLRPGLGRVLQLQDPAYALSLLYVFSLSFYKIIPVVTLIFWGITAVITYKWKSVWQAWRKNPANYSLLVLYLLYLLSLFFTSNTEEGLVKAEVKLTYVLLPVLMAPALAFGKTKIFNLLTAFIAGTSLSILINLLHSLGKFFDTGNTAHFFYHYVSLFHHTSYYAVYLCFAVVAILYLQRQKVLTGIFPLVMLLLMHIAMIFLLSSKAGIMVLFLALLLESGSRLYTNRNMKHLLIFTGSIALMVLLSMYNNRIQNAIQDVKSTPVIQSSDGEGTTDPQTNSSNSRIQVWKTCSELIPSYWLTGMMPGDVTDKLVKSYREHKYQGPAEKRLNCHNQFLQTQLALGIFALLLLISSLLLPVLGRQSRFKRLRIMFVLIISASFMFEAMLETQSGVQFIVFFLVLLSYQSLKNETYDTIFATQN